VRDRHEGRCLFVVHEDEVDLVLVPPQPFHDPVDAVAGQAEDRVDAPVHEPLDERLGCYLSHRCLRSVMS
jgi:hypothetical protein